MSRDHKFLGGGGKLGVCVPTLGERNFDCLLVCLDPIRHRCLLVIGWLCRYERPQTSNNTNHIVAMWWGKNLLYQIVTLFVTLKNICGFTHLAS
jgi:hypothetical protein